MAAEKTSTLTIRVAPGLKEALRRAADREHRSLANMVEVMVRAYCGQHGVKVTGRETPSRIPRRRKANAVARTKPV